MDKETILHNAEVSRWYYESDGGPNARTYYAWRWNSAAPCAVERIDFKSKADAQAFVKSIAAKKAEAQIALGDAGRNGRNPCRLVHS